MRITVSDYIDISALITFDGKAINCQIFADDESGAQDEFEEMIEKNPDWYISLLDENGEGKNYNPNTVEAPDKDI